MPEFTVCGKSEVKKHVKRFGATHLLTTLDVGDHIYKPQSIPPQNHARFSFDDEEDPTRPYAPKLEQADAILAWGKTLPSDARVVVHCWAGQCRSTSSGIALWLQANGTHRLQEAGEWLTTVRPKACPNMLLARYFDHLLGMNGELIKVCDQIGADSTARWWKINSV